MSDRKEAFEETPLAVVWNGRAAQTIGIAAISLSCSFAMFFGGRVFWFAFGVAILAALLIPFMHWVEITAVFGRRQVSRHLALPLVAFTIAVTFIPVNYAHCIVIDQDTQDSADKLDRVTKSNAAIEKEMATLLSKTSATPIAEAGLYGRSPTAKTGPVLTPAVVSVPPPVSVPPATPRIQLPSGGAFVLASQETGLAAEVAGYIAGKLPAAHVKLASDQKEAGVVIDITLDGVGPASPDASDDTGAIWHSMAAITVTAHAPGSAAPLFRQTFQALGKSPELSKASPIALINSANAAIAAIVKLMNGHPQPA